MISTAKSIGDYNYASSTVMANDTSKVKGCKFTPKYEHQQTAVLYQHHACELITSSQVTFPVLSVQSL